MDGAAQDAGPGVPLLADLGEDRLVSAVLAAYPPSPPWVLTGPGTTPPWSSSPAGW